MLHQHLLRKHPNILLPCFPKADRHSFGWGSDAFLQTNRRQLERYFDRLLSREELQEDISLHEFMSTKSEKEEFATSDTTSIWDNLSPGQWFRRSSAVSVKDRFSKSNEKIAHYEPVYLQLPQEVRMTESIGKNVVIRAAALYNISSTVDEALSSLQRYSEALGRVSRSLHDFTSAHVRHLIANIDPTDADSNTTGTFQDDMRATERRFRQLGDRFVDLTNQLQPGLSEILKSVTISIKEVVTAQHADLGNVRQYINKEVHALRCYDQALGKHHELESKRDALMAESSLRNGPLARTAAALDAAISEEASCRQEYEAKSEKIQEEMEIYWEQTSEEFFNAVIISARSCLEVGRVHVDALQAWFPPADL